MKALLQRVTRASVSVDGVEIASIGRGLLVLVGVEQGDGEREVDLVAAKTAKLRIFPDEAKPMNRSVLDVGGEALVVSQFTLVGDVSGGNRPSFVKAGSPDDAERLYLRFCETLTNAGVPTKTGRFAADMQVALVNDGPVTFALSCAPGANAVV
jgi:D-tyrosyl-tRNA(Tyr) deacylase